MIASLYYFAALGAFLSASMLLPALVAFSFQEGEEGFRILLYGAVFGFFSVSTLLAIMGQQTDIERNVAIRFTVFSWFIFPFICAVPIADILDIPFYKALFQTISSITTTGALVFENSDALPKSILFFIAQLQWLGAIATLITLILVLAPWEIGGLPQVASASIAASIVASHSRLIKFCRNLFRTFLVVTLICFVLLLLSGISAYDAAIITFSTMSTGGISPGYESLDIILGNFGMLVVAVFLIISATSVFWHQQIYRFKLAELKQHRESFFVLAVWLSLSFYIAAKLITLTGSSSALSPMTTIAEGLFNAASVVSTSGMESRIGLFSILNPVLIILLIFIGGGCYSTAGGIKFFRIGAIFSVARYELLKLIYPHSVRPIHIGTINFDLQFMKSIWGLFAILIVCVATSTCLLAYSGLSFQAAFTAAIASITNAGPLYSPNWAPAISDGWPAYYEMSQFQLIFLSLIMFVGRLEVVAVLVSLSMIFRKTR